jgi:cyclic pyranopterin phosphate synthase
MEPVTKLIDPFGREITYLRVSVTDKCNYRCTYCMPPGGIALKPHSAILRYEQIAEIVSVGATLGISKVKLTGGEPLVKKNIERLVEMLAAIPGIYDMGMTTNGSLLSDEKARSLKSAGLMRVNISLDTLDPAKFSELTRGGAIVDVLRGIDAAGKAGLLPLKINMIVFASTTREEIERMETFCRERAMRLQTIAHFTLDDRNGPGAAFSTHRPPHCHECNRLRLTADGHLLSCLFSETEIKVDLKDVRNSIMTAVRKKPERGLSCGHRAMSQIGG